MTIDFSPLDSLKYRGCDTDSARKNRDALIERGFSWVEDIETPFERPADTAQPQKDGGLPLRGVP